MSPVLSVVSIVIISMVIISKVIISKVIISIALVSYVVSYRVLDYCSPKLTTAYLICLVIHREMIYQKEKQCGQIT
jgi:hypothetical protein